MSVPEEAAVAEGQPVDHRLGGPGEGPDQGAGHGAGGGAPADETRAAEQAALTTDGAPTTDGDPTTPDDLAATESTPVTSGNALDEAVPGDDSPVAPEGSPGADRADITNGGPSEPGDASSEAGEPTTGGGPPPPLRTILESVLLVVDQPVDEVSLAQVVERPRQEVAETLRALALEYDADCRGFDLRCVAGGWRLYTREECAPFVERFVLEGQQARLTQAALETLAVVAYRQPVTRGRIAAVRGVNVDGVMRTLVARGLVEEAGHEPDSGAVLYRTTTYFLERLGLNALSDLPPLAPLLPDIESIESESDQDSTSA